MSWPMGPIYTSRLAANVYLRSKAFRQRAKFIYQLTFLKTKGLFPKTLDMKFHISALHHPFIISTMPKTLISCLGQWAPFTRVDWRRIFIRLNIRMGAWLCLHTVPLKNRLTNFILTVPCDTFVVKIR